METLPSIFIEGLFTFISLALLFCDFLEFSLPEQIKQLAQLFASLAVLHVLFFYSSAFNIILWVVSLYGTFGKIYVAGIMEYIYYNEQKQGKRLFVSNVRN